MPKIEFLFSICGMNCRVLLVLVARRVVHRDVVQRLPMQLRASRIRYQIPPHHADNPIQFNPYMSPSNSSLPRRQSLLLPGGRLRIPIDGIILRQDVEEMLAFKMVLPGGWRADTGKRATRKYTPPRFGPIVTRYVGSQAKTYRSKTRSKCV